MVYVISEAKIKRLNIFIDETGEFSLGKRAAKLYGVSFVFHEASANISKQLKILNERLQRCNYSGMVHMGDLINRHGDFAGKSVEERRAIFNALYFFALHADIKCYTIVIEKKYSDTTDILAKQIEDKMSQLYFRNLAYFQSFDRLVVYYDGGQKSLSKVVDNVFGSSPNYVRRKDFDHKEKRLFQVADMLTYTDKLLYRFRNGAKLTRSETLFFPKRNLRSMEKAMQTKSFDN